MADTALNEEEIKEFYDTPEELEQKVASFSCLFLSSLPPWSVS